MLIWNHTHYHHMHFQLLSLNKHLMISSPSLYFMHNHLQITQKKHLFHHHQIHRKSTMRNRLSFSDDDQNDLNKSSICWWRSSQEYYDENGHINDISSKLITPKLKVFREMERLAFIAHEGVEDVRHKLLSYKAGDFWLPVGGIKKEDMNIPSVVTIVLVGLSGAGKSSLVNLMYSVLGRSGLIPFAQTSSESSNYTTMFLEEHNVIRSMRSGFCVYDTRGFNTNQMDDCLEELSTWIEDGVCHNQPCLRPGDDLSMESLTSHGRYIKRTINCVMVVANLAEIKEAFEGGDLKSVEAIKDIFHNTEMRKSNENPILILTHGDMLNCEERINNRVKICEYLGISETSGAYDIACLTEQGILPEESDPIIAYTLTEAIYRALIHGDRTHIPKKKFMDWFVIFLTWIMWCLGAFFAVLASFFSKFDHQKKKLK